MFRIVSGRGGVGVGVGTGRVSCFCKAGGVLALLILPVRTLSLVWVMVAVFLRLLLFLPLSCGSANEMTALRQIPKNRKLKNELFITCVLEMSMMRFGYYILGAWLAAVSMPGAMGVMLSGMAGVGLSIGIVDSVSTGVSSPPLCSLSLQEATANSNAVKPANI